MAARRRRDRQLSVPSREALPPRAVVEPGPGAAAGSEGALPPRRDTGRGSGRSDRGLPSPPDYIPVHEGDIVAPIAGPLTEETVTFSSSSP